MRIRGLLVVSFCTAIPLAAFAQGAATPPRMAPSEVVQLFENAGFKVVGRQALNRCGHPAHPRVQFIDLNGDGQPEAHVVDVDPSCYAKPGAYYAVMMRNNQGHWGRMIAEDAIISFAPTRTDGWRDLVVKPGDGACPGTRDYKSWSYLTPCEVASMPTQVASDASPPPRPTGGAYPTGGWKMPVKFSALPASAQASIMRAAGMKQVGGVWKGCEGMSEVDKAGVEIKDLNHDGRPEAIVTDGGTACYGNTGQGFTILRAVPGGWQVMMQSMGIPVYLKTHGADSYPDVQVGGPGGCFGVDRWDGSKYRFVGSFRYAEKGVADKPCSV